jgi:ATP-binding cassette subfamily B protein
MLLSGRAHGAALPDPPLMDNVLIPFQNGKPIDPWLVVCY